MYENIGEKIKSLAKAFCVIEAIAAVITGISLIFEDLTWIGLLVFIGGPFVAWASSWLLYGFGQLVENSDILVEQGRKTTSTEITQPQTPPDSKDAYTSSNDTPTAPTHKWRCSNCGNMISEEICPFCEGH